MTYTDSEQEKISEVREWVEQISGVQLGDFMSPTNKNRIINFFPDDTGRLWVIPNVKHGNPLRFDIFSSSADYIGSLDLPKKTENIQYFKSGKLLIKYVNTDPDIWEAGLYSIIEH